MDQYSRRMKLRAEAIQKGVDQYQRNIANNVLVKVADGTPFDTGNARFNWQTSLDSKIGYSIRSPYFSPPISPRGGYKGAPAAGYAAARGFPVIASFNNGQHSSIHITNNLPYINRLNEGYSTQAPAHYVQTAIGLALSAARAMPFEIKTRG